MKKAIDLQGQEIEVEDDVLVKTKNGVHYLLSDEEHQEFVRREEHACRKRERIKKENEDRKRKINEEREKPIKQLHDLIDNLKFDNEESKKVLGGCIQTMLEVQAELGALRATLDDCLKLREQILESMNDLVEMKVRGEMKVLKESLVAPAPVVTEPVVEKKKVSKKTSSKSKSAKKPAEKEDAPKKEVKKKSGFFGLGPKSNEG